MLLLYHHVTNITQPRPSSLLARNLYTARRVSSLKKRYGFVLEILKIKDITDLFQESEE